MAGAGWGDSEDGWWDRIWWQGWVARNEKVAAVGNC
jgi:hypothetical protein